MVGSTFQLETSRFWIKSSNTAKNCVSHTIAMTKYPFRFKNFEEGNFESVKVVAKMSYVNYQRDVLTRQDIPFLSISGGAGIGKTRNALEIGKYLRRTMDGFSSTIELYIDFSSGDSLRTSEINCDKILGIRLISRCLFQKDLKDAIEAKLISVDDLSDYSVTDAMKEIRCNLCDPKVIGEDDVLPIVIIMDSYQRIVERDDMKHAGKSLMAYIQNNSKC
jgi:hypothetical protein